MPRLLHAPTSRATPNAFTLIELLVVVAILGVLISILLPAMSGARDQAKLTQLLSSARQFAMGQSMYATANRGFYMTEKNWVPMAVNDVDGYRIASYSGITARWPLPFLTLMGHDQFARLVFVNDGAKMLPGGQHFAAGSSFGGPYGRSLFPSWGLNSFGVGGGYSSAKPSVGEAREVVHRPEYDAVSPAGLIAFTKARGYAGSDWATGLGMPGGQFFEPDGYFYVRPPTWPTWPASNVNATLPNTMASDYGYVDFRYRGNTIAGYCDGHAQVNSIQTMRDMRLWSDVARREDNPNYTAVGY